MKNVMHRHYHHHEENDDNHYSMKRHHSTPAIIQLDENFMPDENSNGVVVSLPDAKPPRHPKRKLRVLSDNLRMIREKHEQRPLSESLLQVQSLSKKKKQDVTVLSRSIESEDYDDDDVYGHNQSNNQTIDLDTQEQTMRRSVNRKSIENKLVQQQSILDIFEVGSEDELSEEEDDKKTTKSSQESFHLSSKSLDLINSRRTKGRMKRLEETKQSIEHSPRQQELQDMEEYTDSYHIEESYEDKPATDTSVDLNMSTSRSRLTGKISKMIHRFRHAPPMSSERRSRMSEKFIISKNEEEFVPNEKNWWQQDPEKKRDSVLISSNNFQIAASRSIQSLKSLSSSSDEDSTRSFERKYHPSQFRTEVKQQQHSTQMSTESMTNASSESLKSPTKQPNILKPITPHDKNSLTPARVSNQSFDEGEYKKIVMQHSKRSYVDRPDSPDSIDSIYDSIDVEIQKLNSLTDIAIANSDKSSESMDYYDAGDADDDLEKELLRIKDRVLSQHNKNTMKKFQQSDELRNRAAKFLDESIDFMHHESVTSDTPSNKSNDDIVDTQMSQDSTSQSIPIEYINTTSTAKSNISTPVSSPKTKSQFSPPTPPITITTTAQFTNNSIDDIPQSPITEVKTRSSDNTSSQTTIQHEQHQSQQESIQLTEEQQERYEELVRNDSICQELILRIDACKKRLQEINMHPP
jgi:hypothetical protein